MIIGFIIAALIILAIGSIVAAGGYERFGDKGLLVILTGPVWGGMLLALGTMLGGAIQ